MPHEWDEETIREYWGYCGEIESLDMLVFPDTGNFNGVMFITFKTEVRRGAGHSCRGAGKKSAVARIDVPRVLDKLSAVCSSHSPLQEGYEKALVCNGEELEGRTLKVRR